MAETMVEFQERRRAELQRFAEGDTSVEPPGRAIPSRLEMRLHRLPGGGQIRRMTRVYDLDPHAQRTLLHVWAVEGA